MQHATFRDACIAYNIVSGDDYVYETIKNAHQDGFFAPALRRLFALCVVYCKDHSPAVEWGKVRDWLSEDFRKARTHNFADDQQNPYVRSDYNLALLDLKSIVETSLHKPWDALGMPVVQSVDFSRQSAFHAECCRYVATNEQRVQLTQFVCDGLPRLNKGQRFLFDKIFGQWRTFVEMRRRGEAFNSIGRTPAVTFVQAGAGTGKTFLMNMLHAAVRSHGEIALCMASSGLASTHFENGTTFHRGFGLPVPCCAEGPNSHSRLNGNSVQWKILQACTLFILDEIVMCHKNIIDCIDRTLRSVTGCFQLPFGGIPVVMSGDVCQLLPVVKNGNRGTYVAATIDKINCWESVFKGTLTENMRAQVAASRGESVDSEWVAFLSHVGDGTLPSLRSEPDDLISPSSALPSPFDSVPPPQPLPLPPSPPKGVDPSSCLLPVGLYNDLDEDEQDMLAQLAKEKAAAERDDPDPDSDFDEFDDDIDVEEQLMQEQQQFEDLDPPDELGPPPVDYPPPPSVPVGRKKRGGVAVDQFGFQSAEGDLIEVPKKNLAYGSAHMLIDFVYPVCEVHRACEDRNNGYFAERTIMAPKNCDVEDINVIVLDRFPGWCGDVISLLSEDRVLPDIDRGMDIEELLSVDYLHALRPPNFPEHDLRLKIGVIVILLRSVDPGRGLMNGTKLIVKKVLENKKVLVCQVAPGATNAGEEVLLPRIVIEPSEEDNLSVKFSRKQFPIKLCFAMSVHKCQGVTLRRAGLCLNQQVFSHGQFYVALSRVGKSSAIRVFVNDTLHQGVKPCERKKLAAKNTPLKDSSVYTRNVVYTDLFPRFQVSDSGEVGPVSVYAEYFNGLARVDQRGFNLDRYFTSLGGASGAVVQPVQGPRRQTTIREHFIGRPRTFVFHQNADSGVVYAVSENDSFVTDDGDDGDADAIRECVRAIVRKPTSVPDVRHVDAQSDGHVSEDLADTDDEEEEDGGAVNEYQFDDFVCADHDSDSDGGLEGDRRELHASWLMGGREQDDDD